MLNNMQLIKVVSGPAPVPAARNNKPNDDVDIENRQQ